jgi:hypothetical protein
MSSDSENFEQLRKLMALKKHEQPPPGYFNNFSHEVVTRIKVSQQPGRDITEVLAPVPWLLRLLNMLETKPLFAGAFGMGVCALLISGIVYSEKVQPIAPIDIANTVVGASLASVNPLAEPLAGRMQPADPSSPAMQAQSLFEQIQVKSSSPASFRPLPVGPITNGLPINTY